MRVLHVQKVSGIGGSERHLLSLLPALRASGTEVGMVVLATQQAEHFIEPMRRAGIAVQVLDAPRGSLSLQLVRELGRQIRGFQPDLVHTHLIHADLHGQVAARRAGVKGVSSIHSVLDFYRHQPYRTAAMIGGRLARRTIAISRYAGDFIVDAGVVPSDRLRIVHYGVNSEGWLLSEDERKSARLDLGLGQEDFVVGIAARLIAGKGLEDAIRAVGLAAESNERVRLVIAGEGPMKGSLETAARGIKGKRIQFVGFLQDVKRFMNAVDVGCFPTHPSLGEGFGLAALEAMAAARPVVATLVASLPEIVQDGTTGLLVPPNDVGALSAAFLRLASDPEECRRMGLASRERATSDFSLDAMVRRTSEVYREVVGTGRRPDSRGRGSADLNRGAKQD